MMRRAILEVGNSHDVQHFLHRRADLLLGPLKLQGAERDFIKHRGGKQLDIGILEYQPHAAPERIGKFGILQAFLGERLAAEIDFALLRKGQPVEDPQQGRLAGAIRSQNATRLPGEMARLKLSSAVTWW